VGNLFYFWGGALLLFCSSCRMITSYDVSDVSYAFIVSSGYNACNAFPCDINALNCTSLLTNTMTSADRDCGPCRYGFEKVNDTCIDIVLRDSANENVLSTNVLTLAGDVATAVEFRQQNTAGLEFSIQFMKKVAQVWRSNLNF
jgi:hypothetical protein